MAKKRKKKQRKEDKFDRGMRGKLLITLTAVAILLVGLIVRIVFIQQDKGETYERKVLSQLNYSNETIPYKRGNILDAKGTILATSQDVYNVILDCKVINSKDEYVEPTIEAILACFPDVTEEEVRTALTEKKESQYFVLRKKISYDEVQVFTDYRDEVYLDEESGKEQKSHPNVKGVWFEKEYERYYPYDSLACKILGFTTSGNVGLGGLESYYNDTLNGVNGRSYGYLNEDSNVEKTVKDAVDGNNLITTLDLNIQSIVEKKIAEFDESHRDETETGPGSANTAVIVMNPNNGEILAMADSTGYSLNDPWNEEIFNTYCKDYEKLDDAGIAALDEQGRLDILNSLWQNFCVTYTYEPGSTAKVLTAACGLDSGKLTGDETYFCDGGEQVGNYYIKCVNHDGHGTETIKDAIVNSCNDALMSMSWQIGIDTFSKYQSIFNLGLKTNIDLPGETRTSSLIYSAERMQTDITALPTNAFGQNFNVTMIQMASAVSSVINGGYYYRPHLVKKITDEDGNTVKEIEPVLLRQTVSGQVSAKVREYMVGVVEQGSGQNAKVAGYSMGGKTGTAQKLPREEQKYVVSFISFAPADDPQVLVYVVIDEANVPVESQGSGLSTGLTKEILTDIFPYLNILPDEEIEAESGDTTAEPAVTEESVVDALE